MYFWVSMNNENPIPQAVQCCLLFGQKLNQGGNCATRNVPGAVNGDYATWIIYLKAAHLWGFSLVRTFYGSGFTAR